MQRVQILDALTALGEERAARGIIADLHRVVAGRLVLDPDSVLEKDQANLEKLRQVRERTGLRAGSWGQVPERVDGQGTQAVTEGKRLLSGVEHVARDQPRP